MNYCIEETQTTSLNLANISSADLLSALHSGQYLIVVNPSFGGSTSVPIATQPVAVQNEEEVKYQETVLGIATKIFNYLNGRDLNGRSFYSKEKNILFAAKYPELQTIATKCRPIEVFSKGDKRFMFTPSSYFAFVAFLGTRSGAYSADDFLQPFVDGPTAMQSLPFGDPRVAFYEYDANPDLGPVQRLNVLIAAWNDYQSKKSLTLMEKRSYSNHDKATASILGGPAFNEGEAAL